MASPAKFVKDSNGFRALLNSTELQALLLSKAQAVANGAAAKSSYRDAAYTADVQPGKNRAHARAKSTTRGGYWSALKEKTLVTSLTEVS